MTGSEHLWCHFNSVGRIVTSDLTGSRLKTMSRMKTSLCGKTPLDPQHLPTLLNLHIMWRLVPNPFEGVRVRINPVLRDPSGCDRSVWGTTDQEVIVDPVRITTQLSWPSHF